MGNAIPAQHPAVVLRSHYRQLRALLAIAMIAVVGLTAAVVILANDGTTRRPPAGQRSAHGASRLPRRAAPATTAAPRKAAAAPEPARLRTRYDGGPEEGTRERRPGTVPTTDSGAA